jgi:hypothetical protein
MMQKGYTNDTEYDVKVYLDRNLSSNKYLNKYYWKWNGVAERSDKFECSELCNLKRSRESAKNSKLV